MELLLSKSSMPLIKYVAQLLGWLIDGIYEVLYRLNIPNIGVAIIFFTIIIYICLTPIQVKQQKMSKVMNIINPELQKIQKKYQGKRDTVSQQKMQEETMALYSKYGVSPTGSCLPLLIQLPILFALYQVILYIPGYISRVADIFNGLAAKIVSVNGYGDILAQFVKDNSVRNVSMSAEATQKQVVDFLYVLKQSQWSKLADISQFSSFSGNITATAEQSRRINTFLTINISDSPWDAIRTGFSSIFSGHATVIIVVSLLIGIMIPVLAWFTQWLNMKLMPQQTPAGNDSGNSMANQMNTMNNVMPVISAVMCVTFNMGIGIYWIVGAIVRCVQQVVINRRIANLDPQAMIEKAKKKNEKKEQKRKDYTANISQNARTNVKKISPKFDTTKLADVETAWDSEKVDPNSITAKANMVMDFVEVSAKTVDEAITKACIEMGLSSDQLEIQVLSEGSSGFLGIGSKPAVIQVRAKKTQEVSVKKEQKSEKKPPVEEQQKEEKKNSVDSGEAGQGKKDVVPEFSAKQGVRSEKEVKNSGKKEEEKKSRSSHEEKTEEIVPRSEEEIAGIKKSASEFLSEVFKAMDLPVNITMDYEQETGSLSIDFEGPDMGILIGKRGQTLDSLQYLASLVVNKNQEHYVRVKLDTENYRKRRKETLENLAKNIAYKVRRTRRSVSLEAMNPYERRIIHSALQGNKYVETYSEGNEPYRHVIVAPKKSSES